MSIYTKIYTLDKILRKVENNNTVILTDKKKKIAVYSLQSLQQLLLLEIYSEKFNFLILFLKLESTTVLKK